MTQTDRHGARRDLLYSRRADASKATIRRIADFLPLTYVVKLLRGLWFGETWGQHLLETAVLLAILGICTALAARFFRWE